MAKFMVFDEGYILNVEGIDAVLADDTFPNSTSHLYLRGGQVVEISASVQEFEKWLKQANG